MVTQIPDFTEPFPNLMEMSSEEFELSTATFVAEIPPFGKSLNQFGQEMQQIGADAEAAVEALASAVWVSGTSYTTGQVRYDPVDFFNYRRKTNGAGTTPPRNDPTNWALLTKTTNGGSDTVSSAVDITLTSTGGRLQVITMTAANKKVKLPNATQLEKGAPVRVIRNSGQYRFPVTDNAGAFLCNIQPGQVVAFGCSDTSTAAGVWAISGDALNKLYDGNAPEVINNVDSRYIAVVMITPTKAVCAYKNNTSGFLEVVVLNFGSDSGDPVQITSEAVRNISIAAQSSSQVTVVYQQTANSNVKGYVIDISGNTPTPGAVASIHTAAAGTPEGTGLTALSATQLLCTYCAGSVQVQERILDITGNAISGISNAVNADSTSTGYIYQYPRKITASKALVAFVGTSGQVVMRLQSITGSIPAPTGTVLTITPPGVGVESAFGVIILSSLRAAIVKPIDRDYGGLAIYLVDISGVTPIFLTGKQIQLDLAVANTHAYATKIDANRIYVTWAGGFSGGVDALEITITNDDKIIIGEVSPRQEQGITSTSGYLACDALDAAHVMQVVRNSSGFLSAKTIEIGSF